MRPGAGTRPAAHDGTLTTLEPRTALGTELKSCLAVHYARRLERHTLIDLFAVQSAELVARR